MVGGWFIPMIPGFEVRIVTNEMPMLGRGKIIVVQV